ncbi:Uncharacterised protein [uncultured archaeon]|nr:Uncharacterised protein [uncultured archaeon]
MAVKSFKNPQDVQTAAKQYFRVPLIRGGKRIARITQQMARFHNVDVEAQTERMLQQANHLRAQATQVRARNHAADLNAAPVQPADAAAPAGSAFGRFMHSVGAFFSNLAHGIPNLGHSIANVWRNFRARRLERRATALDDQALQILDAPDPQAALTDRRNQLVIQYLKDYYLTDIYGRYERAPADIKAALLNAGLQEVNSQLGFLAQNNLIDRHVGIRFNGPFFAACGWGAATAGALSVFGVSMVQTVQTTFGVWSALQLNNLPLISSIVPPAAPFLTMVAGAAIGAYFVWRMSRSIAEYARQRNAWIVEPIRQAADTALNNVAPIAAPAHGNNMVAIGPNGQPYILPIPPANVNQPPQAAQEPDQLAGNLPDPGLN